jgi:peptidoglycan/LPS O-acetylase OafA/YrhL
VRLNDLLRGSPGRRFSALYRLRRQRKPRWLRIAGVLGGGMLMLVGVLLVPTPGPGLLAMLLGAGLIATESLAFAQALDRLELRLRELLGGS